MLQRNRSTGWTHAKLSGHVNEEAIKTLLEIDSDYRNIFLQRISKSGTRITKIKCGGLMQKKVRSILPTTPFTAAKTDLYISFDDESHLNISVKKSLGGQVYLIGVENFIEGFERHFGVRIPVIVRRGMELFWGSTDDIQSIIDMIDSPFREYENHKQRLVAYSLMKYDKKLAYDLLEWFDENNREIFEFCFSRGLAKDNNEWADILWHVNKIGENVVDDLFFITELAKDSNYHAHYGIVNGGSTIQLDFGFVQWHQGKMQFHQNHDKIRDLLETR